ncbi:hypothetical protein VPH35_094429 [Triticum aestivum]
MCDRPRRLLAIVVVTSLLSFAVAASSSSNATDFETLLCLKLHLSGSPNSLLGSWVQNNSLHFCSWPGVACNASRVIALNLENSGLDGQMPPCIANLTLLSRIHFPGNLLSSHIPAQLGQLRRLTYLNLSSNSLTGSIPNTLSSTSLQVIDLGNNKFSGDIPESIGKLRNLSFLRLARNSLTGSIPLWLGSSSSNSLVSVILANNSLTGPIPSALAHSSSLQVLNLAPYRRLWVIFLPFGSFCLRPTVSKAVSHDFGLAKFLQSHDSSSTITSTSLAGPRGSIGYIAPEYGIGNKISTAGDVYSYGIIILEMLTGKRPTDVLFKNGLSLQKFVGNAFPEKIRDILDPNIITPSFEDEGVDHGNHAMVGMLSCIMQLVQLGLSCSTETPKDRPTMPDVYAEVSAIKREYSALRIKE